MNHMKSLIALVVSAALLSGCSLLRNPEAEEERQAPRLLDTEENTKKTWYCYGETTDEWNCRQSPDPSLVKTIKPDRGSADGTLSDGMAGAAGGLQSAPGSTPMMGGGADTPPMAETVAPGGTPSADAAVGDASAPDPAPDSRGEPGINESDSLLSLPEDHYTVQLIAERNEENIVSYARSIGITDPLYTQMVSDGDRWYVLLLGTYPDRESAIEARDQWLNARSLKTDPWVRRLGPLQQAIRLARAGD